MAERTQKEILEEIERRLGDVEEELRASAARDALAAQVLGSLDRGIGATHAAVQVEVRQVREQVAALAAHAADSPLRHIGRAIAADPWALRASAVGLAVLLVAVALAIGGDLLPTTISVLLGHEGVQPIQQVIAGAPAAPPATSAPATTPSPSPE